MSNWRHVSIAMILCGLYSCRYHGQAEELRVHQQEFGSNWPFTVEQGTLKCVLYHAEDTTRSRIQGIVFIANNKIYGLNATARRWGMKYEYANLEDIWKVDSAFIRDLAPDPNPREPVLIQMDLGPVINKGLELCP
jgi:hypothetical protein